MLPRPAGLNAPELPTGDCYDRETTPAQVSPTLRIPFAAKRIGPAAICLSLGLLTALQARASEFGTVSDTFGTTTVVMGVYHSTTTNPDGTGINFWTSAQEGAPAKTASFSNPHIAAADAYGNTYIADKASHAILKITPDGLVHTFAGTHEAGFNGDGPAPATSLQIFSPNGLYVFPDGTVYLLDPGNHRIRRVDTHGVMTTIVNDPEPKWYPSGRALWVSPDESLIYYTHEYAPVPPSIIADGATVKQWTKARGIETVCSKDVGFRNPANLAVNPVDGKLYVTDRAEEDTTKQACGLFRIDGPDLRVRITGNSSQPKAATGQTALASFIDQPRGIAFLPTGAYFLCGHKDGNVWYVDTAGVLHLYIQGSGKNDTFLITDGRHPPLTTGNVISQPRAVTLAPNGNLLLVSNDSGYLVSIANVAPPDQPEDLRLGYDATQGITLHWTGVWGRGYRVEKTTVLGPAAWQPVGAAQGAPTATFVEPPGSEVPQPRAAFYRILPSL
ncbi:MAG TPA: hypothetical protein VMB21_09650 [Candidatus Limnocylindria bacterium]|nr:hypothetical protein [Candidatus Limnocylindria bacterium]